jgi:hypothetical protein
MLAFRTCVEADWLMSKIHCRMAELDQQALLVPALREAVGDMYPDATFTSLFYPRWGRHAKLTFTIRFNHDISVLYSQKNGKLSYFWKNVDVEYDDRFESAKAAVDRLMLLRRSEEFTHTALSWYWRKDWVAACVGV